MCLTPIYHSDGKVFACRECNACVETRLNAWVSRALAESVVAGHTYAITMTYADLPDGRRPIGATVFDYSDIQRFLKHLRFNYHRFYGGSGQIRYIACGEQGSKGTQRVHHDILWRDRHLGFKINPFNNRTNIILRIQNDMPMDTLSPFRTLLTARNIAYLA